MNTKIQKLLALSFLIMISILHMKAGQIAPTVTYSPSNPLVGQTVTFTVTDYRLSSSSNNITCTNSARIAPDLGTNSSLRLNVPNNTKTVTHVYNSPGMYEIGYDFLNCISVREKTQGSRALEAFLFGPVGGNLEPLNSGVAVLNVVAPPPSSIPTMGEWGLIILSLITTIFGVVMIKQKYFIPA